MLFARTYDAAKAWEGGCRFVKLRNRGEKPDPDQYNPIYPELLADLWEAGENIIMLEHDVVPYEEQYRGDRELPSAVVWLSVPKRRGLQPGARQSWMYQDH